MKDFNLESQCYKLNDLREQLKEGIEMRTREATSYDYLIQILEKDEHPENFPDDMVDGLKTNLGYLLKDLDHLTMRIEYLTELINAVESGNQDVKDTITLMFNALGIYMPDAPQPEEIQIEIPANETEQ